MSSQLQKAIVLPKSIALPKVDTETIVITSIFIIMCVLLALFLIVIFVGAFVSYSNNSQSTCNSNINNGICPETLYSNNGLYQIKLQSDGNLVASVVGSIPTIIWNSNTNGKGSSPYRLVMQSDGNAVVYDSKNVALWNAGTYGKGVGPYKLIIQDDKNVVIYDSTGKATWSIHTGIINA